LSKSAEDGAVVNHYRASDTTKVFKDPTGPVSVPPSLSAPRAALVVISGDRLGTIFHVEEGQELQIGRDDAAGIPVTDGSVSRRHAVVTHHGSRVTVRDVGSRNGTFVDGQPLLAERELDEGDKIRVGAVTIFKFTFVDELDEEYQRQLLDAARVDPLSGILNRRGFEERLDAETAAVVRHGGSLSLLVIDVDRFKDINDHHGHPAGDATLKSVVAVLAKEMRREDTLARYGGDELLVLLRNTPADGAARLAERLRQQVEDSTCVFGREALRTTISIGVAELTRDTTGPGLLAAADAALYRAKQGGRNRVVIAR
jgi:diguanylate cyclase (GGDEF)-like protein